MNPDDFEQRLRRQGLRQIPPGWRQGILTAARAQKKLRHTSTQTPAATALNRDFLSIRAQLAALLWPRPEAWAGLVAIWLVLLAVNLTTTGNKYALISMGARPAAEVIRVRREEQKLLADLVGQWKVPVAERPKAYPPRPRSERLGGTLRA